jgi:hypothetical protein
LPDSPIAEKRAPNLVASWVGNDKFRPRITAEHNRVLPEGSAKIDGFVAIDPVNEPSRLTPRTVGLVIQANAGFHSVAPEHEQISQDKMALLVDFARQ